MGVIEHIEAFPMLLESSEVFDDIVAIGCTLAKEVSLDSDGDLVIFGLVYSFETLPDLICSIEACNVDHLLFGDVVGYQDLRVDVVGVPDVKEFRISCRIGTLQLAINIWLDMAHVEDSTDSLTPGDPVGVVEGVLELCDARGDVIEFRDDRGCLGSVCASGSASGRHRGRARIVVGAHNLLAGSVSQRGS
jgi:hypothetical protein